MALSRWRDYGKPPEPSVSKLLVRSYLGPGLIGPLVWGTDRMLARGVEDKEFQLSGPEKTCRLLLELSIKFTLRKIATVQLTRHKMYKGSDQQHYPRTTHSNGWSTSTNC